jgi:hypothetical protein
MTERRNPPQWSRQVRSPGPAGRDDSPRFGFDTRDFAHAPDAAGEPGYGDDDYSQSDYGHVRYPTRIHSYPSTAYAQQPPRIQGKNPKGYKRSDERIREDICDTLIDEWSLDASDVEVTVWEGEVTLVGSVTDRAQKHRIEMICDQVAGVLEIHNQIRVQREPDVFVAPQPAQRQSRSS